MKETRKMVLLYVSLNFCVITRSIRILHTSNEAII